MQALTSCRLGYCNALLYSTTDTIIRPIHRFSEKFDHFYFYHNFGKCIDRLSQFTAATNQPT